MQLVTNEKQSYPLDREYILPLFDGKTCNFAGRNYFEIKPGKRTQVDGHCQEYARFMGGYRVKNKHFSLIITAYDQSAKYLLKTVDNDLAVLMEIAHTAKPLKYQ